MTGLEKAAVGFGIAIAVTACVYDEIPDRGDTVPLFSFPVRHPSRLLSAGTFHGTQLFVELDLKNDIEPRGYLTDAKYDERMAPIVPRISETAETYRIGAHRVDLHRATWIVSSDDPHDSRAAPFRYPMRPLSRLYLFKEVPGEFTFYFRGQRIVVPSNRPWRPSIHYYYGTRHVNTEGSAVRLARFWEVVQIGESTIEREPHRATWNVGGQRFTPREGESLRISDAVPARAGAEPRVTTP